VSTSYDPLHGPDSSDPIPASLDVELRLALACVAEVATANIHDHGAMVQTASALNYRIRALIAAANAERGERP
jgi:hypothetical protein